MAFFQNDFLFLTFYFLEKLRAYDEPLRKAAIDKATKDHQDHLKKQEVENYQGMLTLAKEAGVKVK